MYKRFVYHTIEEYDQKKKEQERQLKYRSDIKEALKYRHRTTDGYWGADMAVLADHKYTYINRRGDRRYAAFIDDGFGTEKRKKPIEDSTLIGPFRFTGSPNTFKEKKFGTKCKTLKVDMDYPGLNLYYFPQIYKRKMVTPSQYFSMPESDRYKYRTRKQAYQNDYLRNRIRQEIFKDKHNNPDRIDWKYYNDLIDATYVNDVKNPPCGRCGFSEDDVLYYQVIILDLDSHDIPSQWAQQQADFLAETIGRGCDENGEMIAPVLPDEIVKTGRGLQLRFKIRPTLYTLRWKVSKAADELCRIYQGICDKEMSELSVDVNASKNLAGMKRLEGSFNTRAWSEDKRGYLVNKKRYKRPSQTIDSLLENLGIEVAPYDGKKKNKKTDNSKHSKNKRAVRRAGSGWAAPLLAIFDEMAPDVKEGGRNNFIFVSGCIANEAGLDADRYIRDMNKRLQTPLPDRELDHLIHQAGSGKYCYSNTGVSRYIKIPYPLMIKYSLHTYDGPDSAERVRAYKHRDFKTLTRIRDRERREKRYKRNENIRKLLNAGKSISEISRVMGLAWNTVKAVKEKFKDDAIRIRERNAASAQRFRNTIRRCPSTVKQHSSAMMRPFTAGRMDIRFPIIS